MKAGTPWTVLDPQDAPGTALLGESGDLHLCERSVQPIQGILECQTEMPVLRANYTLKGAKPCKEKRV